MIAGAPWKTEPTLADRCLLTIADNLLPGENRTGDDGETFLEWSVRHINLRDKETAEIAPFTLRHYPWLEHIYNLIHDHLHREDLIERRVVMRKAAQIGATALAINLSFYTLDGRGSVFYALPPGPTAGNFAHARVDPVIGASQHVQEMAGHIDNVGLKTFEKGNLYIRHTSVPKGDPSRAPQLSEAPADLLVIDEFDRVPPVAVPLARGRLGDSRLKWELNLATPTYPDTGIDYEYQNSTQHEPQVWCYKCRRWYWLSWELMRGPTRRDDHARLICPSCRSVIDRRGMWEDGKARWVARHPERQVLGFWIPKLVSDRADLDELWEHSQAKRDIDRQAFYNNDLGLAYEPKGARLTREIIEGCAAHKDVYSTFPARATWTAMGVDVGLELHYWIKERRPDGRERAVAIGSVPDWADLDDLMIKYGVQRCVVDDRPELREDKAFQKRHRGKVWLGLEVDSPDADLARWKRKEGRVVIERTKGLAEASAKVELGVDELPADWEDIPDLIDHLTVSVKGKRVRADGSTVYYFPQTGKPDHLHHAKLFCEVALLKLPASPALGAGADLPTHAPRGGARRAEVEQRQANQDDDWDPADGKRPIVKRVRI